MYVTVITHVPTAPPMAQGLLEYPISQLCLAHSYGFALGRVRYESFSGRKSCAK